MPQWERAGGACAGSRGNPARGRGFTLIEIIVVVGIIVFLAGLLVAVVTPVRQKERILLATKNVRDIKDAAETYNHEFGAYPPDTGWDHEGGWEAFTPDDSFDNCSPYVYLGSKLTEAPFNKVHDPFMNINPRQLHLLPRVTDGQKGDDGWLFVDPWDVAYRMDAVHIQVDPKTLAVTRVGEPFDNSAPADNAAAAVQTTDLKVWSNGPDKLEGQGDTEGTSVGPCSRAIGPLTGANEDNITSWR